jgi:hypothetical protein
MPRGAKELPERGRPRLAAPIAPHPAKARPIAAGFALDQTVPHDQLGQVSLRWIYVHIREHARHAGHADILREQIDGATGD